MIDFAEPPTLGELIVPFAAPLKAYHLGEDGLEHVKLFALRFERDTELGEYLAAFPLSVAMPHWLSAGDIVFDEGAALRIALLRDSTARRARLKAKGEEETRRQCEGAIALLDR